MKLQHNKYGLSDPRRRKMQHTLAITFLNRSLFLETLQDYTEVQVHSYGPGAQMLILG